MAKLNALSIGHFVRLTDDGKLPPALAERSNGTRYLLAAMVNDHIWQRVFTASPLAPSSSHSRHGLFPNDGTGPYTTPEPSPAGMGEPPSRHRYADSNLCTHLGIYTFFLVISSHIPQILTTYPGTIGMSFEQYTIHVLGSDKKHKMCQQFCERMASQFLNDWPFLVVAVAQSNNLV